MKDASDWNNARHRSEAGSEAFVWIGALKEGYNLRTILP